MTTLLKTPPRALIMNPNSVEATPTELWVEIARGLEPRDILSLGQTSRSLRFIVSERAIWIDALHRMCYQLSIFLPSYPIDKMDLNQIQRVTLRPYRRHKLFTRHSVTSPAIQSHLQNDEELEPVRKTVLDLGERAEIYLLIPGGRYLLRTEWFCLKLFDLGGPGVGPGGECPRVLAEIDCRPDRQDDRTILEWHDVCVQQVGEEKLRVAVTVFQGEDARAQIFNTCPGEEDKSLKEVAGVQFYKELGLRPPFFRSWISGERLLVVNGELFVVWDFVRGCYTIGLCMPMEWNFIFIGKYVFQLTAQSLLAWDVSWLFEHFTGIADGWICVSKQKYQAIPATPHIKLQLPFAIPSGHSLNLSGSLPWRRDACLPLTFEVYTTTQPNRDILPATTTAFRLLLDIIPEQTDEHPCSELRLTTLSMFQFPPHAQFYTFKRFAEPFGLQPSSVTMAGFKRPREKGRPDKLGIFVFSVDPSKILFPTRLTMNQLDRTAGSDQEDSTGGAPQAVVHLTRLFPERPYRMAACLASGRVLLDSGRVRYLLDYLS